MGVNPTLTDIPYRGSHGWNLSGQQNAGHVGSGFAVDDGEDDPSRRPVTKLLDRHVTSVRRVIEAASGIPLHENRLCSRCC